MLSVPFLEPLQVEAERVQVLLKNMKALVRLGLQFRLKRTYLVVRERTKQNSGVEAHSYNPALGRQRQAAS